MQSDMRGFASSMVAGGDFELAGTQCERLRRRLAILGVLAGVILTIIGIRFLAVPDGAAHTFGLGQTISGSELHHVIAMRDLWLGLMAVVLAGLREWRALGLWFVMGAGVCVADAAIVVSATAEWWALAFHLGSGVFCAAVGLGCLRLARGGPR